MTDRPLVIVNPKAGSGRGRSLDDMRKVIEGALGPVDFALTERPRHAVEIAKEAAKAGRDTVVATGGDGSIHEVANGLMQAKDEGASGRTKLGIIGRGTGGDLCKTLGIEPRLDRFLSVIAQGRARPMDVGRFRYVDNEGGSASAYFVNILSAGMGGLVDRYVRDMTRWLSGTAAYFVASSRALVRSHVGVLKAKLELEAGAEREVELRTRTIAICNGQFFGSGMQVAPMASVDDGILEVIVLPGSSKIAFAMSSSALYSGAHLKNPDVQHFRCRRISLELMNREAEEVFLLDVDGEPLGRLPIQVEVVPGALPVLLPA